MEASSISDAHLIYSELHPPRAQRKDGFKRLPASISTGAAIQAHSLRGCYHRPSIHERAHVGEPSPAHLPTGRR